MYSAAMKIEMAGQNKLMRETMKKKITSTQVIYKVRPHLPLPECAKVINCVLEILLKYYDVYSFE